MSITSRGAAVPEPPDDGNPHHPLTPWYHKKNLAPYEEHVANKYFEDQRREAARAKKVAMAAKRERTFGGAPPHRGVDLPAVGRDETGRFAVIGGEPRLDWMNLDFDLSVKQVIALDLETGEDMVYRRVQASADDECLWVGEGDVVTPEGHTTERLMEMWESGFRVLKNFAPGWEPPHRCPKKPTACPHCRAMKRTES